MNINLDPSWNHHLKTEIEAPYFKKLTNCIDELTSTQLILPREQDVFNAFNLCSLENIKVVILGQDPYPTPGHAHGLSFSIPKDVRPLAKSLQNIFKEINTDLGKEIPEHGNLERWAKQGVFLLNTVLTVTANEANSHKNIGWQQFTDRVIQLISEQRTGIVFLLWGSQAQKKADLIDESKHHILKSVHPSPLSAYRGFFGCKHFSKANELLVLQQINPINW